MHDHCSRRLKAKLQKDCTIEAVVKRQGENQDPNNVTEPTTGTQFRVLGAQEFRFLRWRIQLISLEAPETMAYLRACCFVWVDATHPSTSKCDIAHSSTPVHDHTSDTCTWPYIRHLYMTIHPQKKKRKRKRKRTRKKKTDLISFGEDPEDATIAALVTCLPGIHRTA